MINLDILSLNGRPTGGLGPLVKDKIRDVTDGYYWSSSEYSATNAWNLNFGSGALNNNNNKNNGFAVRAVAALDGGMERYEDFLSGLVEAYTDCCRKKRSTKACEEYRACMEEDLPALALEILERRYRPMPYRRFVVPPLREAFEASFRDRIVHHWTALRIEPLIEEVYERQGNVSMNCRKGYSPLTAIERLEGYMRTASNGYSEEAWVGTFDLVGCFMNVDFELLLRLLEPFVRENYRGDDLEDLLYVLEVTVRDRPNERCTDLSPQWMFDLIPAHKKLSSTRGIPIGDLPSQLLLNWLLTYLDEVMVGYVAQHGGHYLRFSDDMAVVFKDKAHVLEARRTAAAFVEERLHLRLHPDKVYVQEVRKGVRFVGAVIKPGRTYTRNRTVRAMERSALRLEAACARGSPMEEIRRRAASLNSYLGMTGHTASYAIRRRLLGGLRSIYGYGYVTNKHKKFVIYENRGSETKHPSGTEEVHADGRERRRAAGGAAAAGHPRQGAGD